MLGIIKKIRKINSRDYVDVFRYAKYFKMRTVKYTCCRAFFIYISWTTRNRQVKRSEFALFWNLFGFCSIWRCLNSSGRCLCVQTGWCCQYVNMWTSWSLRSAGRRKEHARHTSFVPVTSCRPLSRGADRQLLCQKTDRIIRHDAET